MNVDKTDVIMVLCVVNLAAIILLSRLMNQYVDDARAHMTASCEVSTDA